MPMSMLRLKPGVNSELTASQNEAGYSVSNLIRFRNGLAEKLGGWSKYYPFAIGGIPKALHAWLDLNENKYLGIGSTTILGAITDGSLANITPQQKTTNFAPNFSTTNGSPNVVVDDSNISNITTFDSVEFLTPIAVGGLILQGVYPVALNLGTTTYRIIADANATSTVSNGGAVPAFTTTSGSATVSVALTAHGLSIGEQINFPMSTTVGGVIVLGTYTVTAVGSANAFSIAVATLATSSTTVSMNSGNARILYYIALGPVSSTTGYGIGTYSSGGYGTGSTTGQQTGTNITATDWTLDNWGQVLLSCPDGGGIYEWQPGTGLQNSQLISDAPVHNAGFFVATDIQIVIAYGSDQDLSIGLDRDPLLVKWSNQSNYRDWTEGPTSQAGSRRLSTGSRIVGGMAGPQFNLLWTDLGIWNMNYIGFPDVFGFVPIGYGCGLVGKHAAVRLAANIFWMSQSNFYTMTASSAPQVIPCTVWDVVFQDLNTANNPATGRPYSDKSWAWANTPFNEVFFLFPRASTGATEPDFFVKYNTLENTWDYGPLDRTAGINQSILGMPISAASTGLIYEHEVSKNADGAPINSYFQSGLYQLSEGNDILFIDWILPDMRFGDFGDPQTATLQITFTSYYFPGGPSETHGPFSYTQSTQYLNTRIRGRLIAVKIESNDLDSFWRVGGMRLRGALDGRL